MSDNAEEEDYLSTPDRIDEVIELAFDSFSRSLLTDLQADYDFERLDTEQGPAIRFTVRAHGGAVHCLYLLRPAAEALIEKYSTEGGASVAAPLLFRLLHDLPLATQIGIENAYDSARLATMDMLAAIVSVKEQGRVADNREQRKNIIKTMNARNAILVEPPKTGPQAEVSVERLCSAINLLRHEGIQTDQITAMAIANKLGCEENSIHQALKRNGSSLKNLLSRFPRRVDDN